MTIRCSAWTILTLAILADVAPSGFCRGSRPKREFTFLAVTASNCTCAPDTLQVSVDKRAVGSLTCGTGAALSVEVDAGLHSVSAQSAKASWPEQVCNALAGRTTPVELGCPAS